MEYENSNYDVKKTSNTRLIDWVERIIKLATPDFIRWCDGSDEEYQSLCESMVTKGTLIRLNSDKRPNSFLCRTAPDDCNRMDPRTYICCEKPADAGYANNWASPKEMRENLTDMFEGCMEGRTLYIVPFSMGPIGSPLSTIGVQITDSPYVVAQLRTLTRMGQEVLDALGPYGEFVRCLHSVGLPLSPESDDPAWPCNPSQITVAHFPQNREVISFGTGFGSNAILSKKAMGLRLATAMGQKDGWIAGHMFLAGMTNPDGQKKYFAGAFPEGTGKTSFSFMRAPEGMEDWSLSILGNDIMWMRPFDDGRIHAINPEAGFVASPRGNNAINNPQLMESITANTIFTNVGLTDDGDVWWDGLTETPPENLKDWQGQDYSPDSGKPAAHPDARITAPLTQCPHLDEQWDNPAGVILDGFVFGNGASQTQPLVLQSFNWTHGIYLSATLDNSQNNHEKPRDPMGMNGFCGTNIAEYLEQWLQLGRKAWQPPIFTVNWFRRDEEGNNIWPGYTQNMRILKWVYQRIDGKARAVESPLGLVPPYEDIDWYGLDFQQETYKKLFKVTKNELKAQVYEHKELLRPFAELQKLPREFMYELGLLSLRTERATREWNLP